MESKFVFDLGTVDLSEGQSAIAALAGDHDPLPLENAIWTQECSGALGYPAWTVLDLRGAIRRGDLRPERHGHRILVTRAQLKEWRERCRVPESPPGSGMKKAETPGASSTPEKNSVSKAAALAIAARLKSGSRPTS